MSTPYPTDHKARKAKRAEMLDRAIKQARNEASQFGRSYNCNIYRHDPCVGALGCLCECHDKPDTKSPDVPVVES